ncbi:VWA domain-containing protein [Haloechinothrix sp. YIM 98757]|uniref:VWA domain-containing protein n=1 Tax=Haloechinothrix aidingensis TaxID=2752311 RepID=A0A838A7C3_9PSEU|nr:VWA domain-containing protein [Haloechinothrix aidingensis]MBA0125098.1 VWA domain-containing protein [Haloechinothrix aidingensis]
MEVRQHRRTAGRSGVVALATFAAVTLVAGTASATGGTVTGDKSLGEDAIDCGGTVPVTVTLDGEDGIAGEPADSMLTLDRSGSMDGEPLSDLKSASKLFVDILDESTDGDENGQIAHGSRAGVVSFADDATVDQTLTSLTAPVKTAIDGLSAGGLTNHKAAFETAQAELEADEPGNNKFMIMFTDGMTTTGGDPDSAADAAKAAGTEIFTIGLGDVDESALEDWASSPDHVFITPDSDDLEEIFAEIGAAIVQPAATDVEVVDTVSSDFSISNVAVSKGSVSQSGNQLTWTMDELRTETVELTFDATHDIAGTNGTLEVNPTVTYTDAEGKSVDFGNPTVDVSGCEPVATCEETNNPSGGNTPPADNQDGFYVLGAEDEDGSDLQIFLTDDESGEVFGPYEDGTKIKLVQAPGAEPREREMNGDVDYEIRIQGDAEVHAVDGAGNESDIVRCEVPPPPG